MKERLIASGVVFAVGFGIGLGLTWALLAKKPNTAEDPAVAEAQDNADFAAAPLNDPQAPASDAVPEAGTGEARTADNNAPPAPADKDNLDEEPDEPEAASPESDEPTDDADKPAATDTPDKPVAQPGVEPEVEIAPKSNAWWKGLAGKRCRVDLGRARALTIRKGTIEDGEKLDWSARFGGNARVGVLFAAEENFVTVKGVATNAAGTPVAAQVTVEKDGNKTTGIIALHTQGLKVTLYPVDAPAATP